MILLVENIYYIVYSKEESSLLTFMIIVITKEKTEYLEYII
jgi:hypothetical protein